MSGGKWSPAGGWWLSNNNNDGLGNNAVSSAVTAAASAWDNAGACWAFGSHNGGVLNENITDASLDGRNMVSFGDTGGAMAATYNWYYYIDISRITSAFLSGGTSASTSGMPSLEAMDSAAAR